MQYRLLNFRLLFDAITVLAFGYGMYEAISYAYLARIFPLCISMVMFVLACINLAQEIWISWKKIQVSGVGFVDLESDWDIPMSTVVKRFARFLALLFLLYGSIWLVGYSISITIFLIFFYRFLTKTTWWAALVAGLAGLGFISLISKLMVIDWPSGIIQDWIHLPWPLG
jgi:putative tricarboxylic transport membrane protein